MKEKPIIFNSEMVRAILEGRKTQTRRVVKFKSWRGIPVTEMVKHLPFKDEPKNKREWSAEHKVKEGSLMEQNIKCPYGLIGDRLWVRETWSIGFNTYDFKTMKHKPAYRADFSDDTKFTGGKWKPSIHMPRWASRITLEITDVRVERVQDISNMSVYAEGIEVKMGSAYGSPKEQFSRLWNSIHKKKDRWEDNPWVWVISFKRL